MPLWADRLEAEAELNSIGVHVKELGASIASVVDALPPELRGRMAEAIRSHNDHDTTEPDATVHLMDEFAGTTATIQFLLHLAARGGLDSSSMRRVEGMEELLSRISVRDILLKSGPKTGHITPDEADLHEERFKRTLGEHPLRTLKDDPWLEKVMLDIRNRRELRREMGLQAMHEGLENLSEALDRLTEHLQPRLKRLLRQAERYVEPFQYREDTLSLKGRECQRLALRLAEVEGRTEALMGMAKSHLLFSEHAWEANEISKNLRQVGTIEGMLDHVKRHSDVSDRETIAIHTRHNRARETQPLLHLLGSEIWRLPLHRLRLTEGQMADRAAYNKVVRHQKKAQWEMDKQFVQR